MELKQLLEEIKMDTQTYLQEDIVKKGRKYFIIKKDGELLPGSREFGFGSIEAATMEMLSLTIPGFKKLPFFKKQEKMMKVIEKWKKEHNVKEKKNKKRYGFETYK